MRAVTERGWMRGSGISRGLWIFGCIFPLVFAAFLPACNRESTGAPPSIILLMVDTLRADYLGTYGFAGEISPGIDRLARESVLFERCYSQAPWTKPAIASLFTSLYPSVHKVVTHAGRYGEGGADRVQTDAMAAEAVTLAEVLRRAGYVTAAFVANP